MKLDNFYKIWKGVTLFIFAVGVIFAIFTIYNLHFQKRLETRKYINEIVELKIDSCHINKYSNHINYEFFIGNKYRASIDSTKFVPFKSQAKVDICIKNILGENVVSDWSYSYFQSDMDKLMKYFKAYD